MFTHDIHDESHQFCKQVKPILSQINASEILRRKAAFRNIDLTKVSDETLLREIEQVLEIYVSGKPYLVNIFFSRILGQKGLSTLIYRIRKLTDEDKNKNSFLSMKKEVDAWYPPKHVVKRGRLNKKGESVLYVADSPLTAIKETKLLVNDLFYLIVYRNKDPFRIAYLGDWKPISGLSDEENFKLQLFNDFLVSEFTKDVGDGTEYLYRPSEMIAKKFLRHPEKDLGWMYPSISNKNAANLCIKPDIAPQLLQLVGVRVCKLLEDKDYNIGVIGDAIDYDQHGHFVYVSPGSELSRKTFLGMNAGFGLQNSPE